MATNAGQLWKVDTLGGHLGNPKLSKSIRHAAAPLYKFRQFVQVKEALGRKANDKIWYNKVSRIDTHASETGISETDVMPEAKFFIKRGTCQVTEFGHSIKKTGKLEALSEFDEDNETTIVLRDDQAYTLDKAAFNAFVDTSGGINYTVNSSGTTAGHWGTSKCTEKNTGPFGVRHIKDIVDQFKKKNVPKYDGNNYVCIGSIQLLRDIKDDSTFEDYQKYGDPEKFFNGEVGRVYGCRFVEDNNCLSNAVGSGSDHGEGVVFGRDAVAEAVAVPEEIRQKIPTDFGRSKGLAWYSILGFAKEWKTTDKDAWARIAYVTSSKS